jgi:endonuclease YncB( thermonuclease family)
LAFILVDDRWINKELVAEDFAWHYVRYSKDKHLAKAEKDAKEGKKGLWAGPSPIPLGFSQRQNGPTRRPRYRVHYGVRQEVS